MANGVTVGAGVAVGSGVTVGVGEAVANGVTVGVGEAVANGVTVGAGEAVGNGVTVGAGEAVGNGVAVSAGEAVGSGVAVGAGVRASCSFISLIPSASEAQPISKSNATKVHPMTGRGDCGATCPARDMGTPRVDEKSLRTFVIAKSGFTTPPRTG